ncbi:gas vesicle protein GvpJ [Kribbella sp. NPDC023855]|uniref:gas vesicle protein GvpJ n=1 Tax=Kribbella sp. NPDC023855 TaxID=3154698 RepID=UPI0033DC647B
MTVATTGQRRSGGYLERPAPSSLGDVIDSILDKGLVIDAYIRVSLVGIELLTIDARIVIASVDTYLRFAEATNRLDLYEKGGKDLPEMIGELTEKGASGKTRGLLSGAKEALLGRDDDEDNRDGRRGQEDEDELEEARPRRRPAKKAAARRRRTEE